MSRRYRGEPCHLAGHGALRWRDNGECVKCEFEATLRAYNARIPASDLLMRRELREPKRLAAIKSRTDLYASDVYCFTCKEYPHRLAPRARCLKCVHAGRA